MQTRLLRFLPLVLVLVVAAVLLIPVPAAASPGEFKAGDLYSNDGATFQYGVNPSTFQGGYQATCGKGDTLSLAGTKPYQDIGKLYWAGTLGDLLANGAKYQATDKVVANIWIDTNKNGQFFAWDGNVFSGLGGDDYGTLGAEQNITSSTAVSPGASSPTWTDVHTLNDLKKLGEDTRVALWVGIAGQAPQEGAISSFGGRALLPAQGCPLEGLLAPGSGPDGASGGSNMVGTFVRGNDDALWYRSWNGATWSDWKSLGGTLTADPGAVSWGDRTDVFVRGSDNALWHIGGNGGSFTGWQKIGGSLTSGPDAASWAAGRLDVFVRGSDSALYHLEGNGSAWSGWERLGGVLTSDPGVVSWGPDRIDIFARGGDNGLWHFWWGAAPGVAGSRWAGI